MAGTGTPRRRIREPHYHLEVIHSARLRIKVQLALSEHESMPSWLRHHGILCDPKKVITPSTWRISYGILTRFANALGYSKTDKLYKDLTNPPPLVINQGVAEEALAQPLAAEVQTSNRQVAEPLPA